MSVQQMCEKRVYPYKGFRSHPCGKPAKFEHEGKWYCGIHDPARLAAIQAKTQAKWNAKHEANRLRWAEEAAGRDALKLLERIVADGPPANAYYSEARAVLCRAKGDK